MAKEEESIVVSMPLYECRWTNADGQKRERERDKFTMSIHAAMAYEDGYGLVTRPLYRWPV